MLEIIDLMHRGVTTCFAHDSVKKIAKLMNADQLRSVVVEDENGEVWGVISIIDIIPHYGKDLSKIKAEEIMRHYKIEVGPHWSIEKAIALMKKRRIEHLVIVNPHAGPIMPVAILTSFDIVRYMSDVQSGTFKQMLKMQ